MLSYKDFFKRKLINEGREALDPVLLLLNQGIFGNGEQISEGPDDEENWDESNFNDDNFIPLDERTKQLSGDKEFDDNEEEDPENNQDDNFEDDEEENEIDPDSVNVTLDGDENEYKVEYDEIAGKTDKSTRSMNIFESYVESRNAAKHSNPNIFKNAVDKSKDYWDDSQERYYIQQWQQADEEEREHFSNLIVLNKIPFIYGIALKIFEKKGKNKKNNINDVFDLFQILTSEFGKIFQRVDLSIKGFLNSYYKKSLLELAQNQYRPRKQSIDVVASVDDSASDRSETKGDKAQSLGDVLDSGLQDPSEIVMDNEEYKLVKQAYDKMKDPNNRFKKIISILVRIRDLCPWIPEIAKTATSARSNTIKIAAKVLNVSATTINNTELDGALRSFRESLIKTNCHVTNVKEIQDLLIAASENVFKSIEKDVNGAIPQTPKMKEKKNNSNDENEEEMNANEILDSID